MDIIFRTSIFKKWYPVSVSPAEAVEYLSVHSTFTQWMLCQELQKKSKGTRTLLGGGELIKGEWLVGRRLTSQTSLNVSAYACRRKGVDTMIKVTIYPRDSPFQGRMSVFINVTCNKLLRNKYLSLSKHHRIPVDTVLDI